MQLERLDEEVDGAVLDRLDGFGDAAEAGHHDRLDVGIAPDRLLSSTAMPLASGRCRSITRPSYAEEASRRSTAAAASAHSATAKPAGSSDSAKRLPQVGVVFDDSSRTIERC